MWATKFTWDIAMFVAILSPGIRDVCTYTNSQHIKIYTIYIYFQIRYALYFCHLMPFFGTHGLAGLNIT